MLCCSNIPLRIYNSWFTKPAWKLNENDHSAWMLLAEIGSGVQGRIKRKLILSPLALAEMSLPDLFAMLQSHVLPAVERRATAIAKDDAMVLERACSGMGAAPI